MKMHCGKIISVAISFLKNTSLPGLEMDGTEWIYWKLKIIIDENKTGNDVVTSKHTIKQVP